MVGILVKKSKEKKEKYIFKNLIKVEIKYKFHILILRIYLKNI